MPVPSICKLSDIAKQLNYTLNDDELQQCNNLMREALQSFNRLDHLVEPTLPVKYPRTPGYRPSADENPYNAWYVNLVLWNIKTCRDKVTKTMTLPKR